MSTPQFYTYILLCQDSTLYTGYTKNLEHRLQMHNNGKGAKYTRGRRPVTLLYYETHKTQREALRREYAIKQLSRKKKWELINKKA